VSAGSTFACGVATYGDINCWGNDGQGETSAPSGTFTQVSAGSLFACGVETDGTLACWGNDVSGDASPPSGTFTQVSAGENVACGLETDGDLSCWGDNTYGASSPPSGTFTSVSAGDEFACGIETSGSVACWGDNFSGQFSPPAGTFTAVSANFEFACGVETSGSVACWGDNTFGESSPSSGTFTSVSAGYFFACGIESSGAVSCWGDNSYGESSPPELSQDSTTTSLTTTPTATEPYGSEGNTSFVVTVQTGGGESVPSGEMVTVTVGTTDCVATLSPVAGGGQGSCSIGNSDLLAGSYTASAQYSGDYRLLASPSAGTTPFTVTMTLSPATVPNGTWETPYPTTTFSTTGNNGTVSFSKMGALPQGLTLTSGGVLAGTPTSKAQIGTTFDFSVTATDADSNMVTGTYSIEILSPCPGTATPYFLSATSGTGSFTGLFCVNASGSGTYSQTGGPSGTGTVISTNGSTQITAFGTNLALLGETYGSFSSFTETAPAPETAGTFILS
jgi:hypothetical protein